MKVVTVVGARPQFIKAAAVSRKIRSGHTEILVHTGQHYDTNMSAIFFEELAIPLPEYNLGIGSASHARQTAQMMVGIEEILLEENPDALMIYGDTNSTLAGALAASKLLIPVIHVEAGLRSFNRHMPEEQNRIVADRLSSLLFCPTDTAVDCLRREGIIDGVYQVGDVMCDAVLFYSRKMETMGRDFFMKRLRGLYGSLPAVQNWYLATVHRAENTDDIQKIERILDAFEQLDAPVIFPVHPRTEKLVQGLHTRHLYRNIWFVEPVGYLDMLFFTKNACKVITDSGGLQKESYILDTPCITVRDQTEWTETLTGNHNVLCRPQTDDILEKVFHTTVDTAQKKSYYGQGDAADKMLAVLGNTANT